MNILFISNDPSMFREESPARLRMRAYADEVALRGGTLHILSRADTTVEIKNGPLTLHGVRTGRIGALMQLPKLARLLIKQGNIKVLSSQDPFEHGWIALKAVQGTQAKLHVQIHTDFLSPWFTRSSISRSVKVKMPALNRLRQRIAKNILPKAHGIRVVSKRIQDSLASAYGNTIVVPSVIPIKVNDAEILSIPLPPHPGFTFALLAVGRLEPEKRIEDILIAIARIKDAYPFLGAFIVGEGRERSRLEKMTRELQLTDRVVFMGARNDARGLMKSAQAFIQTSAYEGYGMTLVEAALAKLPIITSDVGIVGEVFRGYEDVLAAPVGDPTNFAAHIAWLIEDQAARHQLAESAYARARLHLSETDSSPRAVIEDILRVLA